jgi:Fic family protein
MSTRAGQFLQQPQGYEAFIPADLPPSDPPIEIDEEMNDLLSKADRSLGRLDGAARVLPNPDLFVAMYMRHEAVLSSQIEGTQSSLQDVLEFEAEGMKKPDAAEKARDAEEVFNYVEAMRVGLEKLDELPLSLRLIREIHGVLMQGVRGQDDRPGKFREKQNYIGAGVLKDPKEAQYVPPPPQKMFDALDNFEEFIRKDREIELPLLLQCGVAHAQFETIHPFLDGNGRMGRLLIVFMLCEREILRQPVLYISHFMNKNKTQYYDLLQRIRTGGDWEEWLKFFLKGVRKVSQAAIETTESINKIRKKNKALVTEEVNSQYAHPLLDYLFVRPVVSINQAKETLDCSYNTAQQVIEGFENLGLVSEITGQERNRLFRFDEYLELFDQLSID